MKNIVSKIFLLSLISITSVFPLQQSNSDCLDCHSDNELTKTRNGREISLYVNEKKFINSVHGDLDCTDCHENFDAEEIPHKLGSNIAKVNCGNCHDDIVSSFKNNIHKRIKSGKNKFTPTCKTCHGRHYIKNPTKIKDKSKYFCSGCHTNVKYTGAFHSVEYYSDKLCGECHESGDIRTVLKKSVHQQLACSDCHQYESDSFEKHQDGVPYIKIASCLMCHNKEYEEHKSSIHGIALLDGIEDAAKCWDCHGGHNILSPNNSESPTYRKNIPETCAKCHSKNDLQKKFKISAANPTQSFEKSIHGKLLAEGNKKAPNCTSCHGVHDIKNIVQPGSKISPFNLPKTCGSCHPKETKNYEASIHWIYVQKGIKLSPVCNDCHSEHSIKNLNGKNSREIVREMEDQTCVTCHSNKLLGKRFGFKGNQPHSYSDSYHGMAAARGDNRVALCTDCHNIHKILPKSDPLSSVNPKNVKQTCAKCHENATQVFAESYSHISFTKKGTYIESLVRNLYFWLIILVVGGMFLHNLIILIFEIKKKKKFLNGLTSIPRFSTSEVIQHLLLLISFITLAITGFAIKYSSSWWSIGLMDLGMTETLRQIVHRTAAVIMICTGIYHIFYLLTTKRGKNILISLLPRFKDITDLPQNLSYYLGFSKEKPLFDKFDYTEKAEYWALIWGTIIMGLTGIILWFPTIVGNWAPSWLIKVSEIIHFYEAILASLAILVWHWFFVIFHPDQYPMSLTWIDGKMSLQEYLHHHKLDGYKLILEWIKKKNGLINFSDLSENTKYVLNSLSKNKQDADFVLMEIINNDHELEKWINDYFEKEKVNIDIKKESAS